ncbi:MAG: glycosyltransferase [Saprospiraceae bacterium]
MRIAFVTSRFPFPVEKGDKLRAFHQIRLLSRSHEIHLTAVSHKRVDKEDLEAMIPYCKSVKVFRIRWWLLPINLLMGLLEGLPLQVSYFLDRSIKRKVQYHLIRVEPDHLICQLIRAAPYVTALPFTKTLDYMDVFSEGMRQLAGKYRWMSGLFRFEAKRLSAYERTIYKEFDNHIIISSQDKERLSLPSKKFITVIPNGVDEYFSPFPSKEPDHDLVFVGNLGYGPNKEAVHFLVNALLPALKQSQRKVTLLIAGARPSPNIKRLGLRPDVTVKGWVEDIRDAYQDGRIFVAPMFSGLGLQNKILEAMSMGLPCVTTSMVNNAIGAKEGIEILIADDIDGMIRHIEFLLDHPDQYHRMSENARSFMMKNFRWEDQVSKIEEVLISKHAYLSK